MTLEQLIIYGTIQGSVYALLALGYSLVYGVGGIMNLSHGALYILAGYILFWSLAGNLIYIGAMILSIIIITLIGGLVYLIVIKPLQDKPVAILIITFALAMFIEQLINVMMENPTVTLPQYITGSTSFLGVQIAYRNIIVVVTSACTVVLFILFISRSI